MSPAPGQTITLAASGTNFFVTVLDPELDRVDFTWSLSSDYIGEGTPAQGSDGIVGSQLKLYADPAYDAQVLSCSYVDDPTDQSIVHSPTTLTWTLSVPAQEAP